MRFGNECEIGDVCEEMALGKYAYQTNADGLVTRARKSAIMQAAGDASRQQRNRIAVFGPSGRCVAVCDGRSLNTIMDDATEPMQD